MHQKKPVVVVGVEPRITVPIARSLHRLGVPVFVGSVSAADPVLRSRAIAGFFRLPNAVESPNDFLDALTRKLRITGADMLIPTTDGALCAIAQHYDQLKSAVGYVGCPPPDVVDRVLNKETTLTIAAGLGIRVPRDYSAADCTNSDFIRQLAFPLVAKPKQKSAAEAFKVRYLRNEAELVEALEAGVLADAILQEYCGGDGVGVEMLVHGGNCIAAFQHRRLSEFPHTGGVAVKAVAEPLNSSLADSALKLLRGLEWEGVAMVEFRHNPESGVAALMEVNGRYWGTVSLPIQAGADFPAWEWHLAHREVPSVPSSYAVGMTWRWSAGCLKRWHGVLRSRSRVSPGAGAGAQQAAASRERRDALWTLNDPLPATFEWLRTAKKLLVSDIGAVMKRILPKRAGAEFRRRTPAQSQLSDARSAIGGRDAGDVEIRQ